METFGIATLAITTDVAKLPGCKARKALRERYGMAQRLGKARKPGSPTPAMARKIGILLDLVRNRKISLRGCEQTYGASERTVLRDLQELRNIGETAGFRITEREHGDTFELSEFNSRPSGIVAGEKRLRALIRELFKDALINRGASAICCGY